MRCLVLPFAVLGCGRIGFDPFVVTADAGDDETVAWQRGCTRLVVDPSDSFGPSPLTSCRVQWSTLSSLGIGNCETNLSECVYVPGSYGVILTATDANGDTATDEKTFTVIAEGHPPRTELVNVLDLGPDLVAAVGETVVFDFARSWLGEGFNYHAFEWDFGDAPAAGGTDLLDSHVYASAGTYTVTYKAESVLPPAQWPTAMVTVTVN